MWFLICGDHNYTTVDCVMHEIFVNDRSPSYSVQLLQQQNHKSMSRSSIGKKDSDNMSMFVHYRHK